MKQQSEMKGILWANHEWDEQVRKSDGKKFFSVLVGPTDLNVQRREGVAYKWVINQDDTIKVNGKSVNLKSYCDWLVHKTTGGTNPKGVLVVRCNEVVVGEEHTLKFRDGREVPQINLYPKGEYEVDIVVRSRPKEVAVNEAEQAELDAFLGRATSQPIVDIKDGDEPF